MAKNKTSFKKGHKVPQAWRDKLSKANKGRKLADQPCVHHINGNHDDNRPENRIILTRSEHAKLHAKQGDIGFKKGVYYGKKKKCE